MQLDIKLLNYVEYFHLRSRYQPRGSTILIGVRCGYVLGDCFGYDLADYNCTDDGPVDGGGDNWINANNKKFYFG